eukprot:2703-Pleurochrysis_carterae.AAC.1
MLRTYGYSQGGGWVWGRHGLTDRAQRPARGWMGVVATGAPASRAGAVHPTQGTHPRHPSRQWELR